MKEDKRSESFKQAFGCADGESVEISASGGSRKETETPGKSMQGPERDVRASTGLVPSISLGKKASWVRSKVKSVSGARYR